MPEQYIACIYCQSRNDVSKEQCHHCGMPLPEDHPELTKNKSKPFRKMFWGIVIFCLVMMIYLPRALFN